MIKEKMVEYKEDNEEPESDDQMENMGEGEE